MFAQLYRIDIAHIMKIPVVLEKSLAGHHAFFSMQFERTNVTGHSYYLGVMSSFSSYEE